MYIDSYGLSPALVPAAKEVGAEVICQMGADYIKRMRKKWDSDVEKNINEKHRQRERDHEREIEACIDKYGECDRAQLDECINRAKQANDKRRGDLWEQRKKLLDSNPYNVSCLLPMMRPRR